MIYLQAEAVNTPTIWFVLTAIAAIITSLGLKELWPYIFNKDKHECHRNLYTLGKTTMILLNIVRNDYEDNPGLSQAIEDVSEMIIELSKDLNDK